MSDGTGVPEGAEMAQQDVSLVPSQADGVSTLADQRWPGSQPLKVIWTVLAPLLIIPFAGAAIAAGPLVVAIIVPIALVTIVVIGCWRLWRTGVQLFRDGDDILVIRNLLRTYRVPISHIFSMRTSGYGLRITLIDGRLITAGALQSSSRRRQRPDQAGEAMSTIMRAVQAARSARPGETAAAIDAAAPLRARRLLQRVVVMIGLGPAILIASFLVPETGGNLEWRIRWLGIAWTPASLAAAYSLFRARWPREHKSSRATRQ